MEHDILMRAVGGGVFVLATFCLNYLKHVSDSLQSLNINLARVLERIESHDDRITKLEKKSPKRLR